jgi:hypothetical protein
MIIDQGKAITSLCHAGMRAPEIRGKLKFLISIQAFRTRPEENSLNSGQNLD